MRRIRSTSPKRGLVAALVLSATMLAPIAATAAPPVDPSEPAINQQLLSAMRRDLGLDAQQAKRYLDAERSAMARTPEAKKRLGAAYAGSWLEHGKDGRFRLVVAATNADAAEQARALGAETRIVKRSLAQLDAAMGRLDQLGKRSRTDAGIHAWYLDVKTNQLVIEADFKAQDAALDFAARSGVDAGAVRFQESRGKPTPFNIIGGEQYNISNGDWCSIGFPVTRGADTGFVTAGHCGGAGLTTTGTNGVAQGVFQASNFPGTDFAWIRLTNPGAWPLQNWVTNYAGGTVPINGSNPAPVGAAICRSGARTGYRCGTIVSTNVTVNYGIGNVNGLVQSSACAGRGDSGGSFITPAGQAQGVTSGGQLPFGSNDNCAVNPPVTYHQPLLPILNQYGLTLYTGPVAPTAPPVISQFDCPVFLDPDRTGFYCDASYSSSGATTVKWFGIDPEPSTYDDGANTWYTAVCDIGERVRVTLRVTNADGSAWRSALFNCGPAL